MPDPNAILLGVTGGIAIYKAADLCSKLSGAGYDVHVMMTDSARHLISDKLFFTLSRNPVIFDLWDTLMTGIPVPLKSFRASMAFFTACSGSTHGPALKLWTFFIFYLFLIR